MLSVHILHTSGHFWQRLAEHLQSAGGEVTVSEVPKQLPMIVDYPREFLPQQTGEADVTIAVHLHHDLLAELPALINEHEGRALIVPVENPNWVRPGLVRQIIRDCDKLNVEVALPEPFCSLHPATPAIKQFCDEYRVGYPQLELVIANGVVTEARCVRSAPCGLTEWAAERLVGTEAGEALIEQARTLHHSRPCLASMTMVPPMDDTLMHKSLFLFEDVVRQALATARTSTEAPRGAHS